MKNCWRPRRQDRALGAHSPRIAFLPLLLAYVLVLAGSPAGQALALRVHVALHHHGGHQHRSLAPAPHHDSEHDAHEHDPESRLALRGETLDDADDVPVAPDIPHRHHGKVHTHQQQAPSDSVILLAETLSKYLAPSTSPLPPSLKGAAVVPVPAPEPPQSTSPVETPPPRIPG